MQNETLVYGVGKLSHTGILVYGVGKLSHTVELSCMELANSHPVELSCMEFANSHTQWNSHVWSWQTLTHRGKLLLCEVNKLSYIQELL